jgi:hypothetical protein
MLDFLDHEPIQNVAPAVHHAIQWIRQWSLASPDRDDLAMTGDPTLHEESRQLVGRIIRAIEGEEGRPVADFDVARRHHYVEFLSDELLRLARRNSPVDVAQGRRILERLRRGEPQAA